MTNRKSAIRSKEKRMHHMFELEKKAQNLLNEKARLSHELTFQEVISKIDFLSLDLRRFLNA